MAIRKITNNFTVSGPMSDDDIAHLQRIGVKTFINVRPDSEEALQVTNDLWQAKCQAVGCDYYWLPVTSGNYPLQQVERFSSLMQTVTPPIHAFCRTGTRAIHLWLLAIQHTEGLDKALVNASELGVNMPQLLR